MPVIKDGDKVKLFPRQAPHTDDVDWVWQVWNVTDTGFHAFTYQPIWHRDLVFEVSRFFTRVDVGFDKICG